RADRNFVSSFASFAAGNVVIYALGVWWLMVFLEMNLEEALVTGLVPFIAGDLLKILGASALLPVAWKLLGER
ncbi:MAG: biotin transporter BioY, partial [Acidimicrobiia bacterium]